MFSDDGWNGGAGTIAAQQRSIREMTHGAGKPVLTAPQPSEAVSRRVSRGSELELLTVAGTSETHADAIALAALGASPRRRPDVDDAWAGAGAATPDDGRGSAVVRD